MSIYPNPVNDYLTLKLNGTFANVINISVIDNLGRTVVHKTTAADATETIDLSDLHPGLYFIKIENNDKVHVQRIIKQ